MCGAGISDRVNPCLLSFRGRFVGLRRRRSQNSLATSRLAQSCLRNLPADIYLAIWPASPGRLRAHGSTHKLRERLA